MAIRQTMDLLKPLKRLWAPIRNLFAKPKPHTDLLEVPEGEGEETEDGLAKEIQQAPWPSAASPLESGTSRPDAPVEPTPAAPQTSPIEPESAPAFSEVPFPEAAQEPPGATPEPFPEVPSLKPAMRPEVPSEPELPPREPIPPEPPVSAWPGTAEPWAETISKGDLPQAPFDIRSMPDSLGVPHAEVGEGVFGINEEKRPKELPPVAKGDEPEPPDSLWGNIAEDFPELADALRERRRRLRGERQDRMDRRGKPVDSFSFEGEEGSTAAPVAPRVPEPQPNKSVFDKDVTNREVMMKLDDIQALVEKVLEVQEETPRAARFGD